MRALVLLSALTLAACQPPTDGNAAGSDILTPNADDAGGEAPANDVAASTNAAMPPFAETPNAHPTAPEPAPIPARFRGTWSDSAASCADLAHHSRLTISGRTVRFDDYVIFGDSVSQPNPNEFALKGKIEATGVPAEAHYAISADGKTLTDGAGGGTVRVRCA
ncbi:hypothetical protein H9L12_10995 [Sphingomonas rhizophila]|uniref:Lipoprotein n=1 Tax=Sphingomonas rhizophila TaxID=2071607 RepID=A0A7G9SA94_9SPHN|nr:hypothetical protein [Sphingomonas rhizophila]QNN64769.1 hypothetical protein H9L12_10995 [Sphingomonas rhizophila]